MPSAEIILATFNAKYIHASFGLRYLYANLAALRSRSAILEFESSGAALEAVEQILRYNPRIVGFGVYVWNAEISLETVALLKALRPDIFIVIGGPEVSHEVESQRICELADVTVVGEADMAFAEVCQRHLSGEATLKVLRPELPELSKIILPYEYYSDADLAARVIYVEASRGCPFICAFCLSALDKAVRRFDESALIEELARLHDRGLRQFKFVDRTFNLAIASCKRILRFFLERQSPELLVHFELIPDRLPNELKELIAAFAPGTLQFEIGIQTFDSAVAARIDRRHDTPQIDANLRWLVAETGVHLHTDLIVGLPGESTDQFAAGFDRLYRLGPQEIQVGILKRLRGTPIIRLSEEWQMTYAPNAPYEVLQTGAIGFVEMQALKHFARFWTLLANSGHYQNTLAVVVSGGSPFWRFRTLSEALVEHFGRSHGIAANRLVERVHAHLVGRGEVAASRALIDDLKLSRRLPIPDFLRPFATDEERLLRKPLARLVRTRQDVHRAGQDAVPILENP